MCAARRNGKDGMKLIKDKDSRVASCEGEGSWVKRTESNLSTVQPFTSREASQDALERLSSQASPRGVGVETWGVVFLDSFTMQRIAAEAARRGCDVGGVITLALSSYFREVENADHGR